MRVAYVIADRGIPVFGEKGASIHVREMVNAFTELGCELTLIVVRRGELSGELDAQVIEVSAVQPNLPNQEGADKTQLRETQSIAINDDLYQEIKSQHRLSPFSFIYERYTLFGTAGLKAANELSIPLVLEVNSPLLKEQQEYRQLHHFDQAQKNELDLFKNATILAAVSDEMRQYIGSKSDDHNNAYVIPNGVDGNRFHPEVTKAKIDQAQGKTVIGFVGSLKPWHDIKTLLSAFRTMVQNKRDVHLLVVGDGPLREWMEGYISGADMDDMVTITGWTDHAQLPGLLKAMDIAVAPYPALADFYFSPLKLYEYMAVGTPVIASDIGQISKMIEDEENGLLFPPGDDSALALRLEKLIDNSALRESLGHSAVNSVAERTWQNNASKILNLVEQTGV